MKEFRRRAVIHVSNQLSEADRLKKAQEAAAAQEKKALAPKGNRKARRAQARFNKLLNRKLSKANSLGQGVSMSVMPDGGIHVKMVKPKLAGAPVANTETADLVRGEELEKRLDELAK